ncbi:hypothetical protein HYPSUDRAFT_465957 [Hypholoma sublateritium FD-334 SS-4]|uniref:Uncharacterized protein n=1 Tax=Hypholoma sublateritium (strain FD-334 SS-4) TaxID=945553 RepID=A0A0D2P1L0_HYPSF|nr:hypothetical protein HYPSUDRAFT_465957 [Hypholoma sublateritium FD-334 SS-4]
MVHGQAVRPPPCHAPSLSFPYLHPCCWSASRAQYPRRVLLHFRVKTEDEIPVRAVEFSLTWTVVCSFPFLIFMRDAFICR